MRERRLRITRTWPVEAVYAALLAGIFASSLLAAPAKYAPDGGSEIGESPVRLTLEVSWGLSDARRMAGPDDAQKIEQEPVLLELSQGRVTGANAIQTGVVDPLPLTENSGIWRLGDSSSGGVRVRIEAVPSAILYVTAGGQRSQFTLVSSFTSVQRTLPQFPVAVSVKRLDWDSLEVRVPEGNGLVEAGSLLPVSVAFNILSPESEAVTLRYHADLKPIGNSEPAWRYPGGAEVISTNASTPPVRRFDITMPSKPGTYLLEIEASWDQAVTQEGTRLTRWLRRKRPPLKGSAVRRMTLVVAPHADDLAVSGPESGKVIQEDGQNRLDLIHGHGKHAVANGRVPVPRSGESGLPVPITTLASPGLRERLREWRGRDDLSNLGASTPAGFAWVASELNVQRPSRPHRLRITLASDQVESLGVALLDPVSSERSEARIFLDTRMNDNRKTNEDSPLTQSWLVWPDSEHPVVFLCNRSERTAVRIAQIELQEVSDLELREPLDEMVNSRSRGLSLDLTGPHSLSRFGGKIPGISSIDLLERTRNLASYARYCVANSVVLSDRLSDRATRICLDGQFLEDATAPDSLDVMTRVLAVYKVGVWIDVDLRGPLPGLPAPDSFEARSSHLVRLNSAGEVDSFAYQTLHPKVRAAVARRLESVIRTRVENSRLKGVLIRMGVGPTILGSPETGLDDLSYSAFIRETFPDDELVRIPGRGKENTRFEVRAKFVGSTARTAWLDWRADKLAEVYRDWSRQVETIAPGVVLGVVTPLVDSGPAGVTARRAERLGLPPDTAWREIGLDLKRWPQAVSGLVVFRGTRPSQESLAHDVAMSPELDELVARVVNRGAWIDGVGNRERNRSGHLILEAPVAISDESLGHAVAGTDPSWIMVSSESVAGHEDRFQSFARLFRLLPVSFEPGPPVPRLLSGVALRTWKANGQTYFSVANDSPYKVVQTCLLSGTPGMQVDDLGHGSRLQPRQNEDGRYELVLELAPHSVAAIRIGAINATVEAGPSQLPEIRKLEAQAEGIVARLGRQSKPNSLIGPPSPGFEALEPDVLPTSLLSETYQARDDIFLAKELAPSSGWMVYGNPVNLVVLDQDKPHSGSSALRLIARETPALAVTDPFIPPGGSSLLVRTWLKADRVARVRVWVESETSGVLSSRLAEVAVTPDWAERLVRISGLPPEGLDTLRLRYEWLSPTPGNLWIDDVSVEGQGPSEPGRRTQRVLLEALQAFRARRYADFARLLGSHRARTTTQRLLIQDPSESLSASNRQAAESDLPPDHRIR